MSEEGAGGRFHEPVMVAEVLTLLVTDPEGHYKETYFNQDDMKRSKWRAADWNPLLTGYAFWK